MLTQLKDELEPLAREKGLEFRLVNCDAWVESDASYLRRILQNLASNAIRYTNHGKVLIGVRHGSGSVRVEVWDTGPGIPEDQQEKVFDEFHRLNATANPTEGMGLGLAIVERACRLLQHPLHLSSRVGQGTCFAVELPLSATAPGNAPARIPASSGKSLEHQIVVLIENDAELRSAMTITLDNWGLDVLPCANLDQALDLLREIDTAPNVIVADYQLDDGVLGVDAIHSIRAKHGPVPACLVTANRSPELQTICETLNAALFYKPIDADELRGFLEDVLTRTGVKV